MERVFGGMSPLKKILKGSHRFLKQLLQRVDPRPVSTLSLNDNTIAEETKIRNCIYPSIHASTRLSKHLSFNPSIYTSIIQSIYLYIYRSFVPFILPSIPNYPSIFFMLKIQGCCLTYQAGPVYVHRQRTVTRPLLRLTLSVHPSGFLW